MERFKACEKEMKTKAFSKEGLIAAARLDPAEKAKVDMANWISSQVDELSRQVEASEAEIETMQVAGGKKKKAGGAGASAERAAVVEELNERRSWHIGRLEILHRMLENGSLEPEKVGEIKEDISYFVESNGDEDFDEDEGIYDEFLKRFVARAAEIKLGDPFGENIDQGPQVSQIQYDVRAIQNLIHRRPC